MFLLLEKAILSKEFESRHFYSCPQAKLSPTGSYRHHPGRGNYSYPSDSIFSRIYFSPAGVGKDHVNVTDVFKVNIVRIPNDVID